MQDIISLDEYIRRQKEVFQTYIDSNGRETSLLPLLENYSASDNNNYTQADIIRYLTSYISSNLITKEERIAYNNTKVVSNEIIFKRGKAIVKSQIQSQGNQEDLKKFAEYFAKKDGKFKPYTIKYVEKCRDYYLDHSSNKALVNCYKTIMKLTSRGSYDVELLNQILDIEKNQDAIKFINQINISKISLKVLIEEYKILYPANKDDYNRLLNLYKDAYKVSNNVIKFIDLKQKHETINDRIITLKRMLEEYLISDIKDISELYTKYHFSDYKFKETMKDAKTSRDVVLKSLLNKYFTKEQVILNEVREVIDLIIKAIKNGVTYGNGYRDINIYDYYLLKGEYSTEELLKYAKVIYNREEYNEICIALKQLVLKEEIISREELINSVNTNSSEEEMLDVIDYLEASNYPLSIELFNATFKRYIDKDILNDEIRKVA